MKVAGGGLCSEPLEAMNVCINICRNCDDVMSLQLVPRVPQLCCDEVKVFTTILFLLSVSTLPLQRKACWISV